MHHCSNAIIALLFFVYFSGKIALLKVPENNFLEEGGSEPQPSMIRKWKWFMSRQCTNVSYYYVCHVWLNKLYWPVSFFEPAHYSATNVMMQEAEKMMKMKGVGSCSSLLLVTRDASIKPMRNTQIT